MKKTLLFVIFLAVTFVIIIFFNITNNQGLEPTEALVETEELAEHNIPKIKPENQKIKKAHAGIKMSSLVDKKNENNSVDDSNNGTALPSDEMLELANKINARKKLLISGDFTTDDQWESVFIKDNYSEWGAGMTTKLQNIILNNPNWESRPAKLQAVECKSRFCKMSFSFEHDIPASSRNIIYPDLFPSDEPSLSFSSFYDKETGMQNIYVERCTECQ